MTTATHRAIVLHATNDRKRERGRAIGLIVERVEDIERCDPDRIQSPPPSMVTANLAPFLHGYWVKGDGEMIVTLNGEAILAAMPKQ